MFTQPLTAPTWNPAAGIAAGIKDSGNPDLALVVNNGPRLAAAGVGNLGVVDSDVPEDPYLSAELENYFPGLTDSITSRQVDESPGSFCRSFR